MTDVQRAADTPGGRARQVPPARSLSGRKVLVVDDDPRNVFALSGVLEQHGVNVLGAESGLDAIEILNRNPDIDAVLMDIMMPGLDGYDTIRQVRSIPQFRVLPIIAVTARAMHGDREKCLEAGASDYIAKPVDVDALLDMLQSWCRP